MQVVVHWVVCTGTDRWDGNVFVAVLPWSQHLHPGSVGTTCGFHPLYSRCWITSLPDRLYSDHIVSALSPPHHRWTPSPTYSWRGEVTAPSPSPESFRSRRKSVVRQVQLDAVAVQNFIRGTEPGVWLVMGGGFFPRLKTLVVHAKQFHTCQKQPVGHHHPPFDVCQIYASDPWPPSTSPSALSTAPCGCSLQRVCERGCGRGGGGGTVLAPLLKSIWTLSKNGLQVGGWRAEKWQWWQSARLLKAVHLHLIFRIASQLCLLPTMMGEIRRVGR